MIDFVLVLVAIVTALNFQVELITLWASPSGLSYLMLANLAVLAYRAWAANDAFNVVSTGNQRWGVLGFTLVAALLVVPHGWFTLLESAQYSFVTEVFAAPESSSTNTSTPQTPGPTDADRPTTATTTASQQPTLWDGQDRLNILLMGADTGAGRTGIRTDTMMLASIDPETGDTVVVSVPRNMARAELPDGMGLWDCNCFPQLLNDLYYVAEQNPEAFPGAGEPGPRAIKAAIGHLLDLEVHYYALVTLDGFVGIVDSLGGVEIDVPNRIVDEIYPHEDGVTIEHVVIEPGTQVLDGHLALAYVRIRRHADDFARMNRQRCVLGAVLDQSNPIELLASYQGITDALKESFTTDIPIDRLPDLIQLLPKFDAERIAILHIDRDYMLSRDDNGSYYDLPRIKAEAQALIADPSAGTGEDGLSLDGTCD